MKILPLNNYRANTAQQNKKVTFEAKTITPPPARPILLTIPEGLSGDLRRELGALVNVLLRQGTKTTKVHKVPETPKLD